MATRPEPGAVPPAAPAVTVVVVSDYAEGGADRAWRTAAVVLEALAGQDFGEPVEIVLMQHEGLREHEPPGLRPVLPDLQLRFSPATSSAALKDEAARQARAPLVAVLEADCVPAPDWLRHLVHALRAHPDAAAVSGKTLYQGRGALRRCLALLDRGYLDPGGSGPTTSVSNNSAIFPAALLRRYPYSPASSPFVSGGLRSRAMQEAGLRFHFEGRAIVHHALPDWAFVRDMHRHNGYALAALAGPGRSLATILGHLGLRVVSSWLRSWRLRRHYGVRWYELPLALAVSLVVLRYQLQGIGYARRGQARIPGTAYY